MTRISDDDMLSYIPHLLAVYPVISKNQKLTEFTNMWKSYGSVKELQVF